MRSTCSLGSAVAIFLNASRNLGLHGSLLPEVNEMASLSRFVAVTGKSAIGLRFAASAFATMSCPGSADEFAV